MKASVKATWVTKFKIPHVNNTFIVILMLIASSGHIANVHASQFININAISSMDMSYIKKTIIEPAKDNLKLATTRDPNLALWLELLKLTTPLISQTGPNAYAKMDNGLPAVQIDMEFILECFHISDLAGLMMAKPSGNTMYVIGKKYGTELAAAIGAGKQIPPLKIDLDKLGLPPGQHVAAKHMSHLAFGAAIQWIILHEIGHHQLNHFDRNPRDYAESREWELAADTWAIRKIQYLGFGLDPLAAVIEALIVKEEIRRLAGLIRPVELSSHPTWAQRLKNLERFNTKKPPDFGNYINIVEVSSEPITSKFYANELLIPRKPMPGMLGQFRQFGKVIQMPVEHFTDGSIHIYGRSPLELSEIIVSNLGSLYPTIRFRYTNILTGHVSESQTRGYQADMAYYFSQPVKGFQNFTIRDAMELDHMDIFKKHLRFVENNPQVVAKAIKIQQQVVSEFQDIMLKYAKGIVNLSQAQQLAQRNESAKAEEMRLLLGDSKFRALREKMLASPLTAGALEKLLAK